MASEKASSRKSKTSSPLWTREREGDLFFLLLGLSVGPFFPFLFPSPLLLLPLFALIIVSFLASQGGKRRLLAFFIALTLSLGVSSFHLALPDQDGVGDYSGIVYERKENYFLFLSSNRRYYVYEKSTEREVGDFLLIRGKKTDYSATRYEGAFSFEDYLKSRGVKKSIVAYEMSYRLKMPLRMREKQKLFLWYFSSSAGSLLDSFLFDSKDYEDPSILAASEIGALSFFSSSGIILGAFLRLLEKLLNRRLKEKQSLLLSSLPLAFFLFFSPTKIGFWRLLFSRIFRLLLPSERDGGPTSLSTHSLGGMLLILLDPLSPLRTSFLIGVGLSLFLDLTSPILKARFGGVKYKLVSKVSLSLFLLPVFLSSSYFHLLSPLYSIILCPIVLPFFSMGFLSFLTVPFVSLLNGYGSFLSSLLQSLSTIDIVIPCVGYSGVVLTYIFYVCLLAWHFFYDIGSQRGKRVISFGLLGFLALNAMPLGNAVFYSVSFINVGQGDAILIQDGYTSVMIDTGGSLSKDLGKEVDAPYLRSQRIYKLDCLIASHGDYDHIGAASSLSKNFPVAKYVDEASSFPLRVGSLLFENLNVYDGEESNEQSLVLKMKLGGKYFLFTGDAPSSIEKKIVEKEGEIDCDILKAGHHGSKSSSSEEFLTSTSPEVGIISVGERNSYGHPDKEVLSRLEKHNIKVRRTDQEGTIVYKGIRGKTLRI